MGTWSARAAVNFVFIVLVTCVLGTAAMVTMLLSPEGRIFFKIARLWSRLILGFCGVRLTHRGRENVDWSRTVVVMSTHQSHFDILALYLALPIGVRMIAKRELAFIPIFGWALYCAGFVFIDRKKRDSAFASVDRAAEHVARKRRSVVVFPEGTRNPEPEKGLLPFKKGGFHLAMKAAAPIVPVAVLGSNRVLPKNSLVTSSGHIEVRIGPPIDPGPYARNEDRDGLMEAVRAAIEDLGRDRDLAPSPVEGADEPGRRERGQAP
jgi:1-acyl-sn-glycerol-3-phosphate acyltransferase